MIEADVLSVVLARVGTGWGITSISDELKGVLVDISSRADFLVGSDTVNTQVGVAEYDEPANLKSIYECSSDGSGLLEEKTYRQYLEAVADGGAAITGEPEYYARRGGKLYMWPMPDAVYGVKVYGSKHHPTTFTDVLFDEKFNEAIYLGVIAALYEGQIYEQLRLTEKTVDTVTSGEIQDYAFSGGTNEAAKHRERYEAEIAKLITNMETELIAVEYRDI